MDFRLLTHYLLVPDTQKQGVALLYELHPSNAFDKNSFVLLPYYSPETTIAPQFFKVRSKTSVELADVAPVNSAPLSLRPLISRQGYLDRVQQLKQHIQRGDIYEINFCTRFETQAVIDPLAIFLKLSTLARAPYSALLKNGDEFILCASPELFLKKEGNLLSTKPIKGTIRRGLNAREDEALKNQLHQSIKERTENVMAVDVARNDLSQVAAKGSVTVNKLYNIESFETVHQMVSTVTCRLKENASFENIVKATFPMASMTGAPKLRAMQLSEEYEGFERGYYSGAMGLVDEDENFSFSVIIRSIFYNQKHNALSIAVGGAITYLSDPEQEYEECLLKAKALLTALNATIKE